MYRNNVKQILLEITSVLGQVQEGHVQNFIDEIFSAKTIVVHGAGRVGYAVRGFGMRLGHLGFHAYTLGDSVVPPIKEGDLLIIASGSGETQTVYDIASIGKKNNAKIAVITGNSRSRIGQLADCIIEMRAPSKKNKVQGMRSIQPMSTLNEQCLQLLFDAVVLDIMERTGETDNTLWLRHSNLE